MSKIYLADPKSSDVKIGKLLDKFENKVKVYPPGTCPLTVQLSLLQSSKNQTCGKCVPCRDGLPQLETLLKSILDGDATMETYEQMKKLATMIKDTADCAIGYQSAIEVLQGLETFHDEYISHIEKHECPGEMGQKVPCINMCPAHVDIPGYIALVGNEDYAGAINLIRKDNPLPTACAMICEHPCEERCRRNLIDDSINIRGLKKYAVDQVAADQVAVPKANVSTGKKIAVIGGGPAGLTAAYFLGQMGHKVTIYERQKALGGMLRYGIPNYRFPKDRLDEDIRAILSAGGIEVKYEAKVGTEIAIKEIADEYDAMFVAIGAQAGKKLRLENIDANNVFSAVEMLDEIGHGHRPDYTGKTVAVIGGGNVAMDAARTALRLGAEVHIVYRRSEEELPARVEEVHHAKEEGVQFDLLTNPVEVLEEDGWVKGIKCVRMELGEPDASGRRRPVPVEGSEFVIDVDTVIMSLGTSPNPLISSTTKGLEINKRKCIVADETTGQTSKIGVFAGGDAVTGAATVILAMGAGKAAAKGIDEYLSAKN